MPGDSLISKRAASFVNVTNVELPFPQFLGGRNTHAQVCGAKLTEDAHDLYFRQGCRIEFDGDPPHDTDELVRQAIRSPDVQDEGGKGRKVLEFIATTLQAQVDQDKYIAHPEFATTLAAALGTAPIWRAEAEVLAGIFHDRGLALTAKPATTMRISPLADGSGWRIRKTMNWHSYSYMDGTRKTCCMGTLEPILTVEHHMDVYFDSAHSAVENALDWLRGRDPREYTAGFQSNICRFAWSDPKLDLPLLAVDPAAKCDGLIEIMRAILEAFASAFAGVFEGGCRRVDGIVFKPLSPDETTSFKSDAPRKLFGPTESANRAEAASDLAGSDPELACEPDLVSAEPGLDILLQRITRGDKNVVQVPYDVAHLRSYAARRMQKQPNSAANFSLGNEAVGGELLRRRTDDGKDLAASTVLTSARNVVRPRSSTDASHDISDAQGADEIEIAGLAEQLRNLPSQSGTVPPEIEASAWSMNIGSVDEPREAPQRLELPEPLELPAPPAPPPPWEPPEQPDPPPSAPY